ncbi:sensor histidine kinase [Agromyces italicus]|uniref:sensor histidine kinase n=1 Tax=Agromyces italicus TaxID=279572 RepID=UPI0003B6E6BD|nr:sensor histidine kinase [Agromyces italicus]
MTASDELLDRRERQLERGMAVVPYLLLVVSTTLSLLTGDHSATDRLVIVALAALAAAWMWALGRRATLGPLYVTGLVVVIAALCSRDVWFASFFAFVGYLHSWHRLHGIWRFVGVTATAAVSITAFLGGLPEPTPVAILTYLFFIGALVALVSLFSVVGDVTSERSAERKQMVTRLEETIRENAGLQAQLLVQAREAGVLDERQRLAREIHDTIAQGLAGIVTQLQAAERPEIPEHERRRHLDAATRLARESLAEARRSVHALGPEQLESARLPDAIAEVADAWGERHGVRVGFTATGTVRPLHPEVEVTLLRIAQEALANAGKHAGASRVGLTLSYMDDTVALDVRDDGAGFDAARATASGGFGLTSMRQRANRLSGTLEVESEPGGGTAISATVPAVPARDADAVASADPAPSEEDPHA